MKMKKTSFEILRLMREDVPLDVNYYASILIKEPSLVSSALNDLISEGFVADGTLTEKAECLQM